MKKTMMTLLVMTFMAMNSYAQYYYDYATEVIINAQQRWAFQEQMLWMQHQMAMNQAAQQIQWQMAQNRFNWQQFPQAQWSVPATTNTYDSSSSTQETHRMRTRNTTCTNCMGRGFNPKTIYTGNNQYKTVQDRCNFCHGRGTVKETYYE